MNDIRKIDPPNIQPEQLRQFQSIMIKLLQCCHERMRYQSEKFGLPDAELRCLMLFEGERYLISKSLAGRLSVVKSRITKVVDGLVKKDLIQKVKDPADSRITLLSLTSKGQNKLIEIQEFNDWIHKEVLMAMEPEQRKIMLTNLDILKASMESTKGHLLCSAMSQDR
jgi:DNA-binding MarR family transcriptional regulator